MKVLAQHVGQMSVFSPPYHQQPGLGLAVGQSGLGSPWKMSDQAVVWPLWLADLCWPEEGGGCGRSFKVDRARPYQPRAQGVAETEGGWAWSHQA